MYIRILWLVNLLGNYKIKTSLTIYFKLMGDPSRISDTEFKLIY